MTNEAWIIDAARTPRSIGKPGKGAFFNLHPQQLFATVLNTYRHTARRIGAPKFKNWPSDHVCGRRHGTSDHY